MNTTNRQTSDRREHDAHRALSLAADRSTRSPAFGLADYASHNARQASKPKR
jgi:hypothetical protein